jgi:hypothetical protein
MLLVREIQSDHTLGPVHTLIGSHPLLPDAFTRSPDEGFRQACQEAAANNLLLEQSDYGSLLGERRMSWHSGMPKIAGWPFGKAFCFYHRQDGALVGLCKMGWVTISEDEGRTWSQPVVPETLKTGGAKVWGQRTRNGRYAIAYNPSAHETGFRRYPLCVGLGEDGRSFGPLRVVHGEATRYRYAGLYKDMGAQYVRGLAEWADDGSFQDSGMWMVYSVHKEDIWVARLPLPILPDAVGSVHDDFNAFPLTAFPAGWNLTVPAWGSAGILQTPDGRTLELASWDPYLPVTAVRCFGQMKALHVSLRLRRAAGNGSLGIELLTRRGARLVLLNCDHDGRLWGDNDGHETLVGQIDGCTEIKINAGEEPGRWQVTVNGKKGLEMGYALNYEAHPDYGHSKPFSRLVLRAGTYLNLQQAGVHIDPASDAPTGETRWQVSRVVV